MRYLLLGDYGQQLDIEDMRDRLERLQTEQTPAEASQDRQLAALRQETHDLRLRLGVLIKLLIAKKLLSAEEIAALITALEPEDQPPDVPAE
jgi:hypothetical protein